MCCQVSAKHAKTVVPGKGLKREGLRVSDVTLKSRKDKEGVPVVDQWFRNPT